MSIQLYYRYDLFTENHKKLLNATIGQLTFVVPMWKFDEELFSSLSRTVEGIEQNKRWLFLITSDNEYELAEQLVSKYSLESRSIRPVYKEDNLSFLKMLYTWKRLIFVILVWRREIFMSVRK